MLLLVKISIHQPKFGMLLECYWHERRLNVAKRTNVNKMNLKPNAHSECQWIYHHICERNKLHKYFIVTNAINTNLFSQIKESKMNWIHIFRFILNFQFKTYTNVLNAFNLKVWSKSHRAISPCLWNRWHTLRLCL